MNATSPAFLGLRTALYHAPDLARAKTWYADVLGARPNITPCATWAAG